MSHRILPTEAQQHLLRTARLELVNAPELARGNELIEQHHYLHDATLVGAVLRYVAVDEHGEWLALPGYSSASLHLRVRDQWLGWTSEQCERRRHLVTQNSRFLLLPHVRCPNLASRLLSLAASRLRTDFPRVHGHPVHLVETFVDPALYRGAWYQAANWQPLGRSAGWARAGRDYYQKHDRPKEVWVQPLEPSARATLAAETLPAALAATERTPPLRNRLPVSALASVIDMFAQLPDARRRAGTRHRLDAVLACAALAVLAGAKTLADVAAIAADLSQPQLRALRCWHNRRTQRREPPRRKHLSTRAQPRRRRPARPTPRHVAPRLRHHAPAPRRRRQDGQRPARQPPPLQCLQRPARMRRRANRNPRKNQRDPAARSTVARGAHRRHAHQRRRTPTPRTTPRDPSCKHEGPNTSSSRKRTHPPSAPPANDSSPSRFFPPERDRVTKGHGLIETRAVQARAVHPDELPFPHVAQVVRVDRRREFPDGEVETETVFALSSRAPAPLGELALGAALQAHWGIENALHYRRDRTYDEDRCQVRHRMTAQVLATLRNLAIAARHHLAPRCQRLASRCQRQRSRTLPPRHRRLAAKPQRAIPRLTQPWKLE